MIPKDREKKEGPSQIELSWELSWDLSGDGNRSGYSAFSSIFREIAVTSLRGANRTDSASNRFRTPGMTSVFPDISPSYPARATVSASIGFNFLTSTVFSIPARFWNSVSVAPGHRQVTVTPLLLSSLAIASENEIT